MNIRQLRELVLETVAKEQRKNRFQRRNSNRRRQLKRIMENANRKLNEEIDSAKDFYATQIKGTGDVSAGNFFDAFGAQLKDYQSSVVKRLFQDNVNVEGDASQTTMTVEYGNVVVTNLSPSQAEIGASQSLANVLLGGGWKEGDGFHMSKDKEEGAYGLITKDGQLAKFSNPVMAAECAEGLMIIDGHHRWSQVYVCNPTAKIKCVILKGSNKIKADDLLQMVHVAIAEEASASVPEGTEQLSDEEIDRKFADKSDKERQKYKEDQKLQNTVKGSPYSLTKPAKGVNLLTTSDWSGKYRALLSGEQAKIDGYSGRGAVPEKMIAWGKGEITAKELSDSGESHVPLAVAEREGLGENVDLERFLDYFETTVGAMQSNNKPISNSPARTGMPQAGDLLGNEFSEEILQNIADKKIAIPEARWHKGNRLNERNDRNTDIVLSRWKKLAGLD